MTRAYALIASLLLIATPLAGCTSGPEIEDIVDDILGCMDENAENYAENATAELLGDCIYLASMEIFITAMTEQMEIDEMLDIIPQAGYSMLITTSEFNVDMGMQVDMIIEEMVMADLDTDSVYVKMGMSMVPFMTYEYTQVQVGELVNVHYTMGGMMAAESAGMGSYQTRDATPDVMGTISALVSASDAGEAGGEMGLDLPTGDVSELSSDMPADAEPVITFNDESGVQTMTLEYTNDTGHDISIVTLIDDNEDLMSYEISTDNGSASSSISYTVMWGDAVVIEVDDTLPRTSIPINFHVEGMPEDNWDDGGDDTFYCDNGNEISRDLVDDGWDDCGDGSDESDNGGDDEVVFVCDNGEEISFGWVNDGYPNCYDESDEATYVEDSTSVFTCEDGSEVPLSWVQDYEDDCPDGSDEEEFYDPWFGFECADGSYVIYFWSINDGYEDCDDGSDEPEYDGNGDEISVFTCEDGSEVPLSWVQDYEDDCPDGSDEEEFYGPWFGFECADGSYVIYFYSINDGYENCDDGSDEPQGEETSEFTCMDGTVIPFSWVNDWGDDCPDGSDEQWYYEGSGDDDDDDGAPTPEEAMEAADANEDGYVSFQEFEDFWESDPSNPELDSDSIATLWDDCDYDGNDMIDINEVQCVIDGIGAMFDPGEANPEQIFDWMDADDDGQLTASEWADFDNQTDGEEMSEEDFDGLSDIIDMFDDDDSGGLDLYEFEIFWAFCCADDDDGDDDDGEGGDDEPFQVSMMVMGQTLNAPISDFEVRFLVDCGEPDEEGNEPPISDCTLAASNGLTEGSATVDPAIAEYEFTYEYLDYDGDGLISDMDTLVIDNLMPDVQVELYDTWADQYTSESFATAEMLPGFGALMAVVVLLGAAISTRRD